MHYMILKWNQDKLLWEVVHYTHFHGDMENMIKRYPHLQYVHMIDMRYIESHEIMKEVQEFSKQMKEVKVEKIVPREDPVLSQPAVIEIVQNVDDFFEDEENDE